MEKILEDIRVLDLTHAWFGPYCTMLFAGLGARVEKSYHQYQIRDIGHILVSNY